MLPHFHLSGMEGVILFLYIVAVFGALHLAACSFPDNSLSRAWRGAGF